MINQHFKSNKYYEVVMVNLYFNQKFIMNTEYLEYIEYYEL